MGNYKIFAYGSLMNLDSLRRSAPDSISLEPAILYGFKRVFGRRARYRMNEKGLPISVLTLYPDNNSLVNGLVIEVNSQGFAKLKKREAGYCVETLEVQDMHNNISEALAFLYSDNYNHPFLFSDKTQIDYLNTCIEGARRLGTDFYQTFLETTFIGEKNIAELSWS